MPIMGLDTSPRSLGWKKRSGALESFGRDQYSDGLWCPTMRWNHYLMGWGGLASGSPSLVLMDCSMRSHIHAWNMARGWRTEERFGSTMSMVGWFMEFQNLVCLYIIIMRLILLVNSCVLYWFIYGLYGCCFLDISIVIMLVMNMYYVLGPYNTSDYPITIVVIPLINIVVPLLPPYCYYCAP